MTEILIVGAGVFGVTSALALRRRGHAVRLLDPGPLPHPDASSTDISKIVRLDYGDDALFTEMAAACMPVWQEWDERRGGGLFQQTGFMCLCAEPMQAGGFEHDSFQLLRGLGYELERLDRAAIRRRFPQFDADRYADGYFNPFDGWVRSARAVAFLLDEARAAGVTLLPHQHFSGLSSAGDRIDGVITADGGTHHAELVLVAAGAWTPTLLPWLEGMLTAVGQPVLHLRVEDPSAFAPPGFPVWASDIATTGWYGFPALEDGTVKIGSHGPGRPVRPAAAGRGTGAVLEREEAPFRPFLQSHIKSLATAPVTARRLCLYCDTPDNDFLIDHDPEHPGLVVAAGGSGHSFKFAPVLGELIADVVEGRDNVWAKRFRWRTDATPASESSRRR